MDPLIQLKQRTPIFLVALLLACFAIRESAHAVVPAPDGGYPGFNTAEGQNALFNLTTGVGNAAVGWYSLFSNTDGSYNTGLGAGTLALNTADSNTAIGAAAGFNNVDGSENTLVGTGVGTNIVSGFNNTYVGNFINPSVDESNTIRINDLSGGNAQECFIGGIFNNFQPIPAHGGSSSVAVVTLDLANDHLGWDVLVSDQPGAKAPVQAPQRSAPGRRTAPAVPTRPDLGKAGQVEKLEATVAQQQKQIEILTARLEQQAEQIQKVSAHLQLRNSAPQTVVNSQ
jgi:hypothetical protein